MKNIFLKLFLVFSVCNSLAQSLSAAALALTEQKVTYDSSYFSIPYPNGDVPSDKGVCTDVVIRAYRIIGIDLQKEVHEDMIENFELSPKIWGLIKTDKNIDHRRVPNLMTFLKRQNAEIQISNNPKDYLTNLFLTKLKHQKHN